MKNKSNKNLYVVNPARSGWSDSAIAVFDSKGDVFEIFDVYHGEQVPESSYRKLGMNLVELDFDQLVGSEEVEDSDSTMELPSHDLLLKRAKKKIQKIELEAQEK